MAKEDQELFERLVHYLGLSAETTRRGFLKATVGTAVGFSVIGALARKAGSAPFVILENAEGVILADSSLCAGCKRCELACTEFNDGKAQPSLARIKVSRNYNFGPKGVQLAGRAQGGEWGNFRLVQDTCKQCPHPVPCATACPNEAIVVDPKTKARVVDPAKCKGCKLCQKACPWEMMAFDEDTAKATKCFLCNGAPKCVKACPLSALKFIPWRDLTHDIPARQSVMAMNPKADGCDSCH
ncbi:MAG: 4Fe-4S dicluster domain-containing protein [Chitinophagales bacterium]